MNGHAEDPAKLLVRRVRNAVSWALMVGAALVVRAPGAAAQTSPPTPVFEASGYGVLRPWYDFLWATALIVRPADAGGDAEVTTLTQYPLPARADRWRVSPAGAPFYAGSVPLAHNATAAMWADVNGDGATDLVCGEDDGPPTIEVLLMGPAGLVAPGRTYPIPELAGGGYSSYLTSADVNGDGRLDIGVVSGGDFSGLTLESGGQMLWLLASGTDSFVVVASSEVPRQRPTPMKLRVGDPVSLAGWFAPSLALGYFAGLGDGSFEPLEPDLHEASGQPIPADFDHDGFTDLIAGRYLYRGNASGVPTFMDSLDIDATALVDLDHDDVGDLVAVHGGAIRVAKGLGGFNFAQPTESWLGRIDDQWVSSGFYYGLSSVIDVTGDGWSDVVGTSSSPLKRVIYVGAGDPGGGFHQPARMHTAARPIQVALADVLGNDARLDLLVLERQPSQLEVRPGMDDGTFGAPQYYSLPAAPTRFALADLDGDGRQDLAVACDSLPMVCVLPGTPAGFGAPHVTTVDVPLVDLQIADLDEDGQLDVIAGGDATVQLYLRGLGGFAFERAALEGAILADGHTRVADMDGDGHLDLFQFAGFPQGFSAYFGDGRWLDYCDGQACRGTCFEVGDLLGDGNKWVAYVTADSAGGIYSYFRAFRFDSSSGQDLLLPGGGAPGDSRRGYELPPSPRQLAIADVTQDGVPDVLTLSDQTGTFTVLPGLGQGQFGTPSIHVLGPDPVSFALGDVNNDGKPDAAVADGQLDEVWVLRHLGAFVAGVPPRSSTGRLMVRVLSAPNSAVVRLQVGTAGDLPATVELFDTQGRRLARQQLDPPGPANRDVIFEAGTLPRSGVLFARVSQAGTSATARLPRFR